MRIPELLDDGLRVTLPDGTTQPLRRYLIPLGLLFTSAALLIVSTFVPYWSMDLEAPQYPDGLRVEVYVNHLEGDVDEIDELNHYIGLAPLEDGGQFERRIALPLLFGIAALTLVTFVVRGRWSAALLVPIVAFPVAFLVDLWYIMYTYGHSVDPTSALGGAIKPFTPPLFGRGVVGQFASTAQAELGLYLATLAALVALLALWAHRRAYKPLREARRHLESTSAPRPNERSV